MDQLTRQAQEASDYTQDLGAIVSLMLQSRAYRHLPVACITAWIQPALILRQIKIFYDHSRPVGYVTWAYLAPDVAERWISDPRVTLHLSEWNEGDELWIMDLLAPNGFGRHVARQALRELFPGYTHARSLRRNPDGTTRRVTTWTRSPNILRHDLHG